jgi:hypothetical protein
MILYITHNKEVCMKKYSYDGQLTTNSIKKGMGVRMRNGWYGIMADNMKGNTRMVDVDGDYREMGSVYSHDIVMFYVTDGKPLDIGSEIRIDPYYGTSLSPSEERIDGYGGGTIVGHVAKRVEHTKEQKQMMERVEAFY